VFGGRGVAARTKDFFPRFGSRIPLPFNSEVINLLIIRKTGKEVLFMSKNKNFLFKIILTSILIALNIILERLLAYSVWNQTISFSFVTIGFAAVFLGFPYAAIVATVGDILGSLLIPFGPYFFGFTLTNAIAGLITGLFLYKNATVIKITLSVFLNKILCSLILNTIWISILYRGGLDAFPVVFVSRIPQSAIMFVVEIVVLSLLFTEKSKVRKMLNKAFKKM
jgi:ECF transporter S component (folate family)